MTLATLQQVPTTSHPGHKLGLRGNFLVDEQLVRTARDFDAVIARKVSNDYSLTFRQGDGRFDYRGGLDGLKNYLWQLKQPVHTVIRDAVVQDLKKSGTKASSQEAVERFNTEKILVHRILRYAATGSTSVPSYNHEHLDKDFAACHADTEQKILTDDMWATTGEIDIKNRIQAFNNGANEKPLEPAILPGTGFDPYNGFSIRLAHPLSQAVSNDNGENLDAWINQTIHKVTRGRYAGRNPEIIHLTPTEMNDFCRAAHAGITNQNLESIINAAGFNERVAQATARIDALAADIENSPVLKNLLERAPGIDAEARMKNLALASSALTPILHAGALEQKWKHYFYSQRRAAPMDTIAQDFRALKAVIDHYGGEGNISPALAEAIAMDPEFHPAIAFARETCVILEQAVVNAKPDESNNDLRSQILLLRDVFAQASLTNLSMDPRHMPDHYQAVLDVMRLSTDQGDNALKRMGEKFVGNSAEFLGDIYKYPFRGPTEFGVTLGTILLIHTWMNRSPAKDPAAPENMALGASDTLIAGLEDMSSPEEVAKQSAPIAASAPRGREGVDWHKHFNPLAKDGWYPHYFTEAVTGTTKTFIGMFESVVGFGAEKLGMPGKPETGFSRGAYPTVEYMKPINYFVNLAQNYLGHLVYFGSMGAKGIQHGPRGLLRLMDFFNGFYDSARSTSIDRPLALPMAAMGLAYDQGWMRIQKAPFMQDFLSYHPALRSDITTGLAWTLIGGVVGYNLSRLFPKNFSSRKKADALEFTKSLTRNAREIMETVAQDQIEAHVACSKAEIAHKLGEAALAYAEIEGDLPTTVLEAHIKLRYRQIEGREAKSWRMLDNIARSTRLKNTGLTEIFHIHAENLRPVLRSLQEMDLALTFFGEQLGAEGKVYQSFVKGKLDGVVQGILAYQKLEIDERQLEEILQNNLRDVIAAQVHMTGGSPIYEKIFGHELKAKDATRLSQFGAHAKGHQGRIESCDKAGQKIIDALNNKKMIKMRSVTMNESLVSTWSALANEQLNATKASVKISAISLWDMVVDGARGLQHVYENTPCKKAAALTLGSVAFVATGMDIAGYAGPGAEVIENLSLFAGSAGVVATSTGVLLVVNTADDQIMVHMVVGGGCLLLGSTLWAANKYAGKPLKNYAAEVIRDVQEAMTKKSQAPAESSTSKATMAEQAGRVAILKAETADDQRLRL